MMGPIGYTKRINIQVIATFDSYLGLRRSFDLDSGIDPEHLYKKILVSSETMQILT